MRPYNISLAERQIEAFSREIEQWRRDHDVAMRCRDFELLLKLGLDLYETIGRIDAETSVAALCGERDQTDLEAVELLYRLWLVSAETMRHQLDEFERSGFQVEFASSFRSAHREVQGVLTPDREFFATTTSAEPGGDELATLRDAAIDSHRRGETEELIEAED